MKQQNLQFKVMQVHLNFNLWHDLCTVSGCGFKHPLTYMKMKNDGTVEILDIDINLGGKFNEKNYSEEN